MGNDKVDLKLSAYVYIYFQYDLYKNPMTPPGTRVVVHDKPGQCTPWGHRGTPVWYIGSYLDHYISMKCYMPVTGGIHVTDRLQYITLSI